MVRRRDRLLYCLLQVLLGRIELLLKERNLAAEGLDGGFVALRVE